MLQEKGGETKILIATVVEKSDESALDPMAAVPAGEADAAAVAAAPSATAATTETTA
jgi:hypothetical protein